MEYIVLWILALFGLWSLISDILESFYIANREGNFDIMLNTYNQADSIEIFIRKLCQIDMIRNIMVFDSGSTDGTCEIINEIQKKNNRVIFEESIK